ncbi:hypothetical protein V2I01_36245 [Micromonospora sp. BRA006-A]|nr:hypothetical protein [Micromonospora sp. BRA006-A]
MPDRSRWGRLHVLDWIAIGLAVLGVVFVLTGLLPAPTPRRRCAGSSRS